MRQVIKDKRCPKCEQDKPRTPQHWYRDKRTKDGWQRYCKPCLLSYHGGHRGTGKVGSKVQRLRVLKEASPCMDCQKKYPFYVMQYDHRPGEEKKAEIGRMVDGSYAWSTVIEEIAKCDLVCANCHAARTWLRQQKVRP